LAMWLALAAELRRAQFKFRTSEALSRRGRLGFAPREPGGCEAMGTGSASARTV
jgi:hypothetical protein